MDATTVMQAIGTLGFPIVCCFILFWYINKRDETTRIEIEELRKTIENNTLVIQEFISKNE